ncbi:helix-turn-helix transcriptional regulator [Yersinia massiliensis]|uniref:helix-turn-helix transcriptional regulator n=1 Tax=Yersinia massiliensis TaxID=419257 RepID=UPI0021BDE325|nr:AlpA family phage regulatory protein [Yersinia massiliensis]
MITPRSNLIVERPPMDALIDMKFITSDCLLSDKWIYRLISENKFPKPIKLGRLSRWRAGDYYFWRDELESRSNKEYEDRRIYAQKMQRGRH